MVDLRKVSAARDNTLMSLAQFSGLDRLDCLIILVAVLVGTLAKQHRLFGLSDWFLEWVSPFLLMVAGYWLRRKITELIEIRRIRGSRKK